MDARLEYIIENINHKVQITVPNLDAKALYTVVGVTNFDTDKPLIICKKDNNATFNVPCNKIGEIIMPSNTELYCYVFDYSVAGVFRLDLQNADKKPEDFENDEELLRYWGFNPSQCNWMLSGEKLDIIEIDKPLK